MFEAMTPLQIPGAPGGLELAVILLIAILLFGANKIPKLARSTGQAIGEFKRGREEMEKELEEIKDTASLEDTGDTGTTSPSTGADHSAETTSTAADQEDEA